MVARKAIYGEVMSASHLQTTMTMTAQEYIESKLKELRQPVELPVPQNADDMAQRIFQLLTSKKFRKYSLTAEYAEHIRGAIKENVTNNAPINITFMGGSYKLWRLQESPQCDWAELFSFMYYSQWVKSICSIYEPGVWFDFMLDDFIVAKLHTASDQDVAAYRASRDQLLEFLKPYQPKNLRMTNTGISTLFDSTKDYETKLAAAHAQLQSELPNGILDVDSKTLSTIELNANILPEQKADPQWREKIETLHAAYMRIKGATGYSTMSTKIRAFNQPFPNGTCIAVGSTKDSIVKFWVGVGVLRRSDDSYRQLVLSPKQLETAEFDWQDVNLGIGGKNFSKIRVLR